MVLQNKKKRKILCNNNVGVGEDKISELPDALIHHILSFLPTKCVMSTCILSKRWKYVSNSVPTLDFHKWLARNVSEEEKPMKTQQFMNFLDTVLYLHEKPKIQKFSLSFGKNDPFDEARVNKWIGIVIMLLDLCSLRLNVPSTISFPRMKLLQLYDVEFMNGISIEKLISNCPILEKLEFLHCCCLGSKVVCIANSALKYLYIENHYDFKTSTLKIRAPNLSSIKYGLKEPGDFAIDSFPSLVEAHIFIPFAARASVLKLLEKLSNVKLLKMSGACFMLPSTADILLLPGFNNLVHIEVSSHFFYRGSESLDSVLTMRRFFKFLQLSPNLQTIVFVEGIHLREEEDDDWSLDPKCSLPHLKSVELKYFGGKLEELNAVELLLKYAGFLETVTIVASSWLSKNQEELINVMKLLLMFPRPANCVVKFLTSSENA